VAQVASALNTTITSSTSFTTFYATTQAGQYEICGYEQITVAGTGAGTVELFAAYTGDGYTRTPSFGSAVAVATLHAVNSGNSPCTYFYADSGTNIQWSITVAGSISAAPTLRYGIALNYMGQ
jgi:hypothetical protein